MFRRMQDDINEGFFNEMNRIEQDRFLQYLYDRNNSVSSIAKKFSLSQQSIYNRINAHRGRGPGLLG